MYSKLSISIFLILYIIKVISSQSGSKVPEIDLNKAVSCLHVLSKKFEYEIDQKVYSSTMLACFTSITEDDAKEILVAVQQDMVFLSSEEIDKLCDVNNLKKIDQKTLSIESRKLQNALREFDKMRDKKKDENYGKKYDDNYNDNEDYKKAHPSQGNKLGKFMKGITNVLKFINNSGKIIIGIMCLYFLYFLFKNCGKDNYVHKYEDYAKIAKQVKKNKKKKN